MKNKILLILLLSLLGLSGGYYVYLNIEPIEINIPPIPSQKVVNDNFYTAKQLLKKSGYINTDILSLEKISYLSTNNTVFLPNANYINPMDKKTNLSLLKWIKNGGHLVIGLGFNDLAKYKSDEILSNNFLLNKLGITPISNLLNRNHNTNCIFTDYAEPFYADFTNDGVLFSLAKNKEIEWLSQLQPATTKSCTDLNNTKSLPIMARFFEGNGWVTVIGNINLFNNKNITKQQHAALFISLLSLPQEHRQIIFVHPINKAGLLSWLIHKAPYAVFALFILLFFILWHVMPRFGSILESESYNRPGLLIHLHAIGNFFLNRQDYQALLTPLREEIQYKLHSIQKTYPEINDLAQIASIISRLPQMEIIKALSINPENKQQFLHHTRVLIILLDSLKKQGNIICNQQ